MGARLLRAIHQRVAVFVMHLTRQRLSQHVGVVVCRRLVHHLDVPLRHELAYLKIATLDVARTLARLQILGQSNGELST